MRKSVPTETDGSGRREKSVRVSNKRDYEMFDGGQME